MRRYLLSLGLLGATLSLIAAKPADFAANWPQWRGPNADGSAPGATPPLTWDGPTGKNVRWKAPLVGTGSATPVVWGDQVFVASALKTDRVGEIPAVDPALEKKTAPTNHYYRFVVTSYDRKDGKVRWQKTATEQVPHEGHHETHTYAAGSPTTDGERLYVSFGSFGIYCYDLAGKQLWTRELGRLATRLGWGEAVTPVVHDGNLLINYDQEINSALYCLDAKTGETRWKTPREEKSTWTTPLVTEHAGRTQVILNGNNRIRSYDLETGEALWTCSGMTVNPIPSALRYGDNAIAVSGYKGSAAVSIPLDLKGEAKADSVLWRYGKGTPYVPSPVLVGDRLYFTEMNTNALTVLDAKTGKVVIDREKLPKVTQFYASPIYAGGHIYFVDRTGSTAVLKPGDTIDLVAANKLGEPVDASPVAVGKELFLRGNKHLYCLAESNATGVSLFDGKTFDGWEGDTKNTWRIEDGSIVGGSLEKVVPRNEFLCTTKSFGDFELTLKFKLVGDKARANAGVQIRTKRIPNHHEVSGYQADIGNGYWGALYDESRRNKVLAAPKAEEVAKALKIEEWNDYKIRAEGSRIQIWLNGLMTVDYTEKDAKIDREGIIGLQIHGGAKSVVYYKDLVIQELTKKQ